MKNKISMKIIVSLLVCSFILFSTYGCDASGLREASTLKVIESTKSITYYLGEACWAEFDSDRFDNSLAEMQGVGANTVWLVLPWIDFQPVALPEPVWNEKSIENLNIAIAMAEERGMKVILPLCYLGASWAPEGIDFFIWTADENMYDAFKAYSKALIARLLANGHSNMIFLLYGEGSYPAHKHLREYEVTIKSFKQWCRNSNKDIAYWNSRWGTSYTWDSLLPFTGDVKEGDNEKNMWRDYWKWSTDIVRVRHGGLARELREGIKDKALLGYHDDLMITKGWAGDTSPIPTDNPYQFLSIAHYYSQDEYGSLDGFISSTDGFVAKSRRLYPEMPLGIFEIGLCEQHGDRNDQAKVVGAMADIAMTRGVGINFWMWQDHSIGNDCEQTFGLLTREGEKKPAYFAIKKVWRK